jgi:gas vesicle protein
MDEIHRSNPAAILLAFLAGAVSGAMVALLTAPQSGRETRSRLKDLAKDASDRASHVPQALNAAYAQASRAARQAFIEALEEQSPGSDPHAGRSGH